MKCLRKDTTKNYVRCRQKNPGYFDKKSLRTKKVSNKTKLIVGCPKGNFKKGRCKVGLKVQSILTKR